MPKRLLYLMIQKNIQKWPNYKNLDLFLILREVFLWILNRGSAPGRIYLQFLMVIPMRKAHRELFLTGKMQLWLTEWILKIVTISLCFYFEGVEMFNFFLRVFCFYENMWKQKKNNFDLTLYKTAKLHFMLKSKTFFSSSKFYKLSYSFFCFVLKKSLNFHFFVLFCDFLQKKLFLHPTLKFSTFV